MVLVIESLVWRSSTSDESSLEPPDNQVVCQVFFGHDELARLPSSDLPSRPLALHPSAGAPSGGPTVRLRLFREASAKKIQEPKPPAEATAELEVPLWCLVNYGAPLYASLWLGVDTGQEALGPQLFERSLELAQQPETSKVRITVFKPEDSGIFDWPEVPKPDIKGFGRTIEDIHDDFVTVSPPGDTQVAGLLNSVRASGEVVRSLQQALFEADDQAQLNVEIMSELFKSHKEAGFLRSRILCEPQAPAGGNGADAVRTVVVEVPVEVESAESQQQVESHRLAKEQAEAEVWEHRAAKEQADSQAERLRVELQAQQTEMQTVLSELGRLRVELQAQQAGGRACEEPAEQSTTPADRQVEITRMSTDKYRIAAADSMRQMREELEEQSKLGAEQHRKIQQLQRELQEAQQPGQFAAQPCDGDRDDLLASLRARGAEQHQEILRLQSELQGGQEQRASISREAEAIDDLTAELQSKSDAIDERDQEIARLQAQAQAQQEQVCLTLENDGEMERLRADMEEERRSAEELRVAIDERDQEIAQLRAHAQAQQEQVQLMLEHDGEMERVRADLDEERRSAEDLRVAIDERNQEIAQLRAHAQAQQEQVSLTPEHDGETERVQAVLDEERRSAEDLRVAIDERDQEIAQLRGAQAQGQQEQAQWTRSRDRLTLQHDGEMQRLQANLDEERRSAEELRAALEAQQAVQQEATWVDENMEALRATEASQQLEIENSRSVLASQESEMAQPTVRVDAQHDQAEEQGEHDEISLWQQRVEQLTAQIDEHRSYAETNCQEWEAHCKAQEEDIAQLQAALESGRGQAVPAEAPEEVARLQATIADAQEMIADAREQLSAQQAQLEASSEESTRLQSQVDDCCSRLHEQQSQLDAAAAENVRLQSSAADRGPAELSDLQAQLQQRDAALSELQTQLGGAEAELRAQSALASDGADELERARRELELEHARTSALQGELQRMQHQDQEIGALKAALLESEEAQLAIRADVDRMEAMEQAGSEELQHDVFSAREHRAQAESERETLREQLAQAESEREILRKQLDRSAAPECDSSGDRASGLDSKVDRAVLQFFWRLMRERAIPVLYESLLDAVKTSEKSGVTTLSRTDMRKMLKRHEDARRAFSAAQAFKKLDLHGTGRVSPMDFQQTLQRLGMALDPESGLHLYSLLSMKKSGQEGEDLLTEQTFVRLFRDPRLELELAVAVGGDSSRQRSDSASRPKPSRSSTPDATSPRSTIESSPSAMERARSGSQSSPQLLGSGVAGSRRLGTKPGGRTPSSPSTRARPDAAAAAAGNASGRSSGSGGSPKPSSTRSGVRRPSAGRAHSGAGTPRASTPTSSRGTLECARP